MFGVCVAAAVNRYKINLLLQFDSPPSAAQVMSRAISAFSQLQQDRGIFTPFFCNCAMIFDDENSRWVPLERSSQVVHNCQVYMFQPDVPDVAGAIPDPIPASSFLNNYRSPARNSGINASQTTYDVSPRGLMPTDPDLSYFPVERQIPVAPPTGFAYNNDNNNSSSMSRNVDFYATGNGNNNNDSDNYGDSPLTAQQREILRREADRGGSTFVPGGSILKEEREKEDAKVRLQLDEHRQRVREETKRFADQVSPPRK